ncbi:MAG: hypothetical protein WCC69_09190 [Pirellulales bacterium]
MTPCLRSFPFPPIAIALATMLAAATGCTSALTTASLRGLPWDTADKQADVADETAAVAADGDSNESDDADAPADHDARRAAAIEEAIARLSRVGSLDEQTQATLMATLNSTAPEDWPVVISEFASALTAAGTEAGGPHVVAKVDIAAPATVSAPVPAPSPDATPEPAPVSEPAAAPEPAAASTDITAAPSADPDASPAPTPAETADVLPASKPATASEPVPGVSIRTACFASRVQAWGVLDRFPADRFAPGQEVIVYVELDDLAATTAADGHTTCIDASLRLVAADGRTLSDWKFEPIAETCASRRRDYFARFVVRIPETAAAGRGHVALTVTDTLAGKTVETTLPLEITID